jgi:hypothetical protein
LDYEDGGLLEALGMKFGWCRCWFYGTWFYRPLYWPAVATEKVWLPVVVWRRLGYWSGVRTWSRGRHWDRRSRYGER